MGLLDFFTSESKSTQSQRSLGVEEASRVDVQTSGDVLIPHIAGVEKIRDVEINYSSQGIDTSGVAAMISAYSAGQGRSEEVQAALADQLAAIAASSTGTESETGKLLNKWAIPLIGLAIVGMFLLRRR
ncbi:MAG: hypothetical protein A2V98_04840 [Planctomycetes bacterium RBG_16_64_12]|nr:MAG: hypothetical protein A2V98_04840 [Planctomycetes bacterium RBG_16_64_12]